MRIVHEETFDDLLPSSMLFAIECFHKANSELLIIFSCQIGLKSATVRFVPEAGSYFSVCCKETS